MNRVFSFLLWPKREARGPWKQGRKKRGSITCRTDRANEANKMFIIWLCWLFRFWEGDRELEVRTATYGPGIDQSQHAKSVSHIINTLISAKWLNLIGYSLFAANFHLNFPRPLAARLVEQRWSVEEVVGSNFIGVRDFFSFFFPRLLPKSIIWDINAVLKLTTFKPLYTIQK